MYARLKYTICIPKPNAFLLTKADPFYMEKNFCYLAQLIQLEWLDIMLTMHIVVLGHFFSFGENSYVTVFPGGEYH